MRTERNVYTGLQSLFPQTSMLSKCPVEAFRSLSWANTISRDTAQKHATDTVDGLKHKHNQNVFWNILVNLSSSIIVKHPLPDSEWLPVVPVQCLSRWLLRRSCMSWIWFGWDLDGGRQFHLSLLPHLQIKQETHRQGIDDSKVSASYPAAFI